MNTLFEFLSLTDPNVRYVTLGAMLLTGSAAMMGTYMLLNKKALIGDAIAHAVLPGVCIGFMLAGNKDPLWILAGAFITGALSVYLIDFIVQHSRIKEDTAIALVLSVFFGAGIVLLTIIQKSGNAAQSGLDQFLFGRAAAINRYDLMVFGITAALLVGSIILLHRIFSLMAFDYDYARGLGFPVKFIQFLQTSLIVLAVVIGIQAVGVVLMAAVLITPAVAARYWSDSVRGMLVIAGSTGLFSGFAGAFVSYAAPSMPTGPWMVVVASIIAFVSMIVSPRRGVLMRHLRQQKLRKTVADENLLKLFYQLAESDKTFFDERSLANLSDKQKIKLSHLPKLLTRLEKQGYLEKAETGWRLTEAGLMRAQRIVKIHRLWELYLTTYMNIAPDHVHDDADTIEHLLTPELEQELEKQLGYPESDPHQSQIPYRQD